MAFIALKKAPVDALTPQVRKMVRLILSRVDLNETPPVQKTPAGVAYYVYDDPRITIEDAAFLTRMLVQIATAPALVTTIPDGTADPFAYVAVANGAPAALKMFNSPPADWTPVS